MSHTNNDLEKGMLNINLGTLSNFLLKEDYKNIFLLLIQTRPDQLKGCIKEILISLKTETNTYKFIKTLVDILKLDLNSWNNAESIKAIFNDLNEIYLCLYSTGKSEKSAAHNFDGIIESVFHEYLVEVGLNIQNCIANIPDSNLYQLSTTLLTFTQLLDIKNYEPILYPMAKFAENLFQQYNNVSILQPLIVEFILHINHRLVNYLAVIPGNPVSKGLKESIYIYTTIRTNIVSLNYTHPEIITKALNILEHRSRFFGLTADAIPENENHGDYIVVDPLNTAFEDDDVYDDYEKFLANLPN